MNAATPSTASGRQPGKPRRDSAARLFGYDVFISFALGPAPRGSLSYASDLARRLRERDFTVFFSEDEASPGDHLDSTLRKALLGSRALVVIANRGTLLEPRWIRTEVESFRSLSPARPVVPISVGGALQDSELVAATAQWLPFQDKIWLDETQEAADTGLASAGLVDRLSLVPNRVRSNVKWRWLVRAVGTALLLLAVGLGIAAKVARDNEQRARAELMRSVSLRMAAEAPAMVAGARAGGHERALQQVLAAYALGNAPVEVGGAMLSLILAMPRELKVLDTGALIRAATFSPESGAGRIVTGGAGGRVQRWDPQTLRPVGSPLPGPTVEVYSVAYSPDGRRIAAGDLAGRLWLWNAQSGEPLSNPAAETAYAIRSLAFMPDGQRIVSGSVGGTLRFWDASTGKPLGEPIEGIGDLIAAIAVSPDGQRIVTGGDYHQELWTLKSGRWTAAPLQGHEPPATASTVAFSRDGTRVASGSDDGSLRLWDGRTGKPVGQPMSTLGPVKSARFSPDGALLLSGGAGGALQLWDVKSGQRVAEWLKNQDGLIAGLDFSADGRFAVTGGEDGMLRLWDSSPTPSIGEALAGHAPALSTPICKLENPALPESLRSVAVLAWSADCAMAVARSKDGLQLIEAQSGKALGDLVGGHKTREVRDANAKEPRIQLVSAAFSRDSQHIVTGSQNGSIQRWEMSPLRPAGQLLLGHEGTVVALAFSADGRTIASGGSDGRLRLWDAKSGEPIGPPLMHPGGVKTVGYSADGSQVVSQGNDGTLRAWPAPASWRGLLCGKLTRDMSAEQWGKWLSPEIAFRQQCPRDDPSPDAQTRNKQ